VSNFFKRFIPTNKDTAPVNHYEGFTADGRVFRRGTVKAEIPGAETRRFSGGDDPPASPRDSQRSP
jgi:hypothetical protein